MFEHKECPVCGNISFSILGLSTGQLQSPPESFQQAGTNAYLKHVIMANDYSVKTIQCRYCNHIFLSPSFTEDELDRLYSDETNTATKAEYRSWEATTGDSWTELHSIPQGRQRHLLSRTNSIRRELLAAFVNEASQSKSLPIRSILDVGGLTGSLTRVFSNVRRYVYDKNLSQVDDDVIAISNEEQLKSESPFDLLVLSHVLEHVPTPVEFLSDFRKLTSENGMVYVEVPLEYCGMVVKRKGAPLSGHVSYFTPHSVRQLLVQSGFGRILRLERMSAWYGEQRMVVIKAVAARGSATLLKPLRYRFVFDLLSDCLLTWRTRKHIGRDMALVLEGGSRPSHT